MSTEAKFLEVFGEAIVADVEGWEKVEEKIAALDRAECDHLAGIIEELRDRVYAQHNRKEREDVMAGEERA